MIGTGATMTDWRFTQALQQLREAVQRGIIDPEHGTLSKQGQLLAEHCMMLTPPKNQAQGRDRIAADLQMLFNPINPDAIKDGARVELQGPVRPGRRGLYTKSQGLQRLVRTGTPEKWHKMASGATRGKFAGTTAVEPSLDLHRPHKYALMAGHRGNVRKRIPKWVTLFKQRGALRSVIRTIQQRVGWAKAGWLRGYLALGGIRAPAWVTRHGQTAGIFIDGRQDPVRPFIEIRNNTSWGKTGGRSINSEVVVEAAMKARERAMITYFNTQMRLADQGVATRWQVQQRTLGSQGL